MRAGNYKEKYPAMAFQLNTFGFGYSVDSQMLLQVRLVYWLAGTTISSVLVLKYLTLGYQLAEQGNGTFAFIPDAVIVGTTFVNRYAQKLNL